MIRFFATFFSLKKAALYGVLLVLIFIILGQIEIYNNIFFKIFYIGSFPHNLYVSFFPILFMYILKTLPYVALFILLFLIFAMSSAIYCRINSGEKTDDQMQKTQQRIKSLLLLILDLLFPVLLIYILFVSYKSGPFTLSYYFYYLNPTVSSSLDFISFNTLNFILKFIFALCFIFFKFRISQNGRTWSLTLLFIVFLGSIPNLIFLIHYFSSMVKFALYFTIIVLFVLLIFYFFYLLKNKHRYSAIFLAPIIIFSLIANISFFKYTKNDRVNVVHIILDTLRMKSFNQRTMPFLYSLKDKGVWFPNSFSSSDNTVTSHNAIYYGKYPSKIGLEHGPFPSTTIMEVLRSHSYHTMVVSANGRFCVVNGYNKGVDDFYEAWKTENHVKDIQLMTDYRLAEKFRFIEKYFNYYHTFILNKPSHIDKKKWGHREYRYYNYEPAEIVNEFVKIVIEKNPPSQPYYLFVNYLDPHAPYLAPQPQNIANVVQKLKTTIPKVYEKLDFENVAITDTLIFNRIMLMWNEIDSMEDKKIKDDFLTFCYEENLGYLDQQLQKLFDYFEEREFSKNTLFIVTSDHGESIGEHNLYDHGNKRLYNQEIKVPLFILFPEQLKSLTENKVVSVNTQSVDFFPTIIDLLGIKTDVDLNGESLLPNIFSDKDSSNIRYSISEYTGVSAIIDSTFKLIVSNNNIELYNLGTDPNEEFNMASIDQPVVQLLKTKLDKLINTTHKFKQRTIIPESQRYDPETLKQLKTLGYIK